MDQVNDAGKVLLIPLKVPSEEIINFTSDTTGLPKGVLITYGILRHVLRRTWPMAITLHYSFAAHTGR
ncbi:hypothetical protein Ciccas_005223 [Cichlidogyrus casuarinus]|uniref:AMP-dependent synthetase/ligase domain-containing protein n=1 Tax=Cichlidogyrus casuarinus TaxID=1844966 RepID=A0ABD2Q9H1_9PLAT